MATADEIRQRVEQADHDRMAARQNAAADVAGKLDHRQQLRAQLEQAERDLAQSVSTAEQVMTWKELASFLDVKPTDVEQWATAGGSRARQRGSGKRSSRSRSSRPRAGSAASTGATTAAPGVAETTTGEDSSAEESAESSSV